MNIFITNSCVVWGMMVEGYHNINSYGGNIADVGAKYFLPDPCKQYPDPEDLLEAGRNLVELCRSFSKVYKCKVYIDDMDCWSFSEIILSDRACVRIEHHKKNGKKNGKKRNEC